MSTVIIGGGFYGLRIALFLHEILDEKDIVVLEKENDFMTRASYVNQARVHNGYHYPRSVLTAYRSAVNFPRFIEEYPTAVQSNFDKYYAIARHLSKVNADQFENFSIKIGAPIEPASDEVYNLFDPKLTEAVFKVKEYGFNSHELRRLLLERIRHCRGITLKTSVRVEKISESNEKLIAHTNDGSYEANHILNCTYAGINTLHRSSDLPLVKLKHEVTEMCLIKLPKGLEDFSVTMMDGPFFSIMPFPTKGLHTLSHVRYTPHESWQDDGSTDSDRHDTHDYLKNAAFRSNYQQMYNDVVRFIPKLSEIEYKESIIEVKTVLLKSEDDDSRPILFRSDFGMDGYVAIMGGKLDNIYDVFEELTKIYDKE